MRIAVVTPFVASILGHRAAFVVARALAAEHDVTLVAHAVSLPIVPAVRELIAPARLEPLSTPTMPRPRMSRILWQQLVRGPDHAIADRLRALHEEAPLDAIVVFSDEGHWIGEYVRNWSASERPVTLVEVLELLDHPFLLRYERSYPTLRALTAPVYPLVHRMEARRLRAFDGVVTISSWATTVLGYLYGLTALGEVVAYDDRCFASGPEVPEGDAFIAVPTAALDRTTVRWIERLHNDGVPLRLYGPRACGTVPTAGFLGDAEMASLLRQARATLFLFDYEAFGLIPVESLAVGTPVITLPKEGPFGEHRTDPNVHFASTYSEVLDACRRLLSAAKTTETVRACRSSAERYRPAVAAENLVRAIQTAKRARKPGP